MNLEKSTIIVHWRSGRIEMPRVFEGFLSAVPMASSSNSLSPEIRRFIAQHIQAVEQMEVLCLLAENPEKKWSVNEVFRAIQSSEKSVGGCLDNFHKAGLLAVDAKGFYRFRTEESKENLLAMELARAYRQKRVSVIKAIYSKTSVSIPALPRTLRPRTEKQEGPAG